MTRLFILFSFFYFTVTFHWVAGFPLSDNMLFTNVPLDKVGNLNVVNGNSWNTTHAAAKEIYYVTFVKGAVRLSAINKILKLGDKITDTDKLIFPDKNSRVTCISPIRGRFDLSPENASQTNQKEWVAEIKNILVQSSSDRQLSTRELSDEDMDPEIIFKNNSAEKKVLLIENYRIKASKKYLSDKKNFLFLKYTADGITILKKIPVDGQSWYFDSSVFTNSRHEFLPPEKIGIISLCYQQIKNGTPVSRVLIKFLPVLISMQEIKNQLFLLQQNLVLMGMDQDAMNNEMYNHFCTNYGYLHPAVFKQIIKE